MNPKKQTERIYTSIVAGTLPSDKTDANSIVTFAVMELLGTESVHLISSYDEARSVVHYMAVSSVELGAAEDLAFPLSLALPGHPEFKGDGCYLQEGAPISALIEVKNGVIRYIANESYLIENYVNDLNVPIYRVSESSGGVWKFSSFKSEILNLTNRFNKILTIVGGILLAVILLLSLVFSFMADLNQSKYNHSQLKQSKEDEIRSYEKLFSALDNVSPLSQVLYRMQYISSNTIKAGGWINHYKVIAGNESFEIVLPEWISRDYLEPFGANYRSALSDQGVVVTAKSHVVFDQ
jgi:preprotein translocase subunit SecG